VAFGREMSEIAREDQLIIFTIWLCAAFAVALSTEGKTAVLLCPCLYFTHQTLLAWATGKMQTCGPDLRTGNV